MVNNDEIRVYLTPKLYMKNLLLIFLLALPLTRLHAQGIIDDGKDISVEIVGGKTWEETDFHINIQKKGSSVFIRYETRGRFDFPGMNKDTLYQTLTAKYKNAAPNSHEREALSDKLLKIMHQHRPTFQDSIAVDIERYLMYKPLIKYIARADEKAFDGGYPDGVMDMDFLHCKITYQDKTRTFDKNAPLSISSPLLYTFLKETLKIGKKAGLKAPSKIDEVFEYLF
jgi:hypothetical protein